MSAPFLLDLTHTSHTRARTGIQRVARSLCEALGGAALPVTHDPYLRAWRPLEDWEQANLAATAPAQKRGAHWPLAARWRGRTRRWFGGGKDGSETTLEGAVSAGLLVPEVFSPAAAAALPALLAATRGPRVAVFHDAIALKYPELTPTKTVARFPGYLRELLAFDGIAANSEDSRVSLLDYWKWLGVSDAPPVAAIPLGVSVPARRAQGDARPVSATAATGGGPVILSVGSIEARKNHLALLEACETLWGVGLRFELRLVGLAHAQTGQTAMERIRALQAAGRPLRYDGPLDDAALATAYDACSFTVYPSLIEGFGLPVLESLAHGKPCVCSARSAIGESARGGGCFAFQSVDASSLAAGIHRLLTAPGDLAALTAEAQQRTFRTWDEYSTALVAWAGTLRRR